ncbi:MAG: hypothetical protein SynsKO_39370 [Synoicihabitans sp.]
MRAFCTIATPSHVHYAFALAESLKNAGNPELLHVLVFGGALPEVPADSTNVRLLDLEDLPQDFPPLMRYYYSAFELCNALKPYLVRHLFNQSDISAVIFLDSDLLITSRFDRIWKELESTSLLLTLHHFSPPSIDALHTNEVDVIDLGFMNGGFAAWRAGEAANRILDWMCERFAVYGFYRYLGMAADQKLLPLVLSYFPDVVRVSRDPGLNIAYWNAHERSVKHEEGSYTIEGKDVVFFHMSGCQLEHPDLVCAYISPKANELLLQQAPWLEGVVADYLRLIRRFTKHKSPATLPYLYDRYDGIKLNPDYRRLLFSAGKLDRRDQRFWAIRITVWLRAVKRLFTGVRPLT